MWCSSKMCQNRLLFVLLIMAMCIREFNCKCRHSYNTICDSFEDVRNKQQEKSGWTELIIGNETVLANPLINYSLSDLVNFRKLVSLTIVGQVNHLVPLLGRCTYEHNLQVLSFYKNDLRVIETDSIPNIKLKKLSLVNNNIEYLQPGMINPIGGKIEIMDLSDNKLEAIEQNVFTYNDKPLVTKVLTVKNNKISHIQVGALPTSLETLNLDRNNLRFVHDEALEKLHKLRELTLSHNHLYDIPNVSNLTKLSYIDLSNNAISSVTNTSLKNLKNLYFIDLSSNKITTASFTDFNLQQSLYTIILSLGFNQLTDFGFDGVTGEYDHVELFLYGNPFNCDNFAAIQKSMNSLKIRQNSCDSQFHSEGKTPYCLDYSKIFYLDVPAVKMEFLRMIENNKKLITCVLNPGNAVGPRVMCVA